MVLGRRRSRDPERRVLFETADGPVLVEDVPVADAFLRWQELRRRDDGWPVIFGPPDELDGIVKMYEFMADANILKAADGLEPRSLFEMWRTENEADEEDDPVDIVGEWPA